MNRLFASITIAFTLLLPLSARAQFINPIPRDGILAPGCNFITGEFHFHCIPIYMGYLIQLVFGFLGVICMGQIIWAGYDFAFSGLTGDNTKAKGRLQNAIMGLIFSILSFLIVNTIVNIFFTSPVAGVP